MIDAKVQIFTTHRCPYCDGAKRLLDKKGVTYKEIYVDVEQERLAEMVARSQRRSVPQIFIGDTHIGGYDDMVELDYDGKLDELISQASATNE